MDLTKVQLSEEMRKHTSKGNGLHDLMEIMIECMMVAERGEFWLIIRAIRVMAIVPARLTVTVRNSVPYTPRPLRQLSSADSGHTSRSGGGM